MLYLLETLSSCKEAMLTNVQISLFELNKLIKTG